MSGEELRAREGEGACADGRRASEEGLAGDAAASVPGGGAWRLAYVTDLELPHPLDAASRDACLRRLSALFLDDACARRGGLGRVTRAVNATGEPFAVKALVLPDDGPGDPARRAEIVRRAFDEEYESQRRLVGLEGFPQLYGRGMVDGKPVIIMEWVEGETLEHAARALAVDDDGRLSPLTAARLGRDLFELLVRMDQKAGGLAHRDLSPANVMVRTRELPLADQAEAGAFDLRIVDFGSSALAQRRETSLTEGFGAPRGATPDYAPPEMLTDDVPQAPHARVAGGGRVRRRERRLRARVREAALRPGRGGRGALALPLQDRGRPGAPAHGPRRRARSGRGAAARAGGGRRGGVCV